MYNEFLESKKYFINETAFSLLMRKRIYKVLLLCSNYDSYMLEEDGRIDEQIFNEYASLNLRYPPIFRQANNSQKAFRILQKDNIDLVITMLNLADSDPFELANKIKNEYSKIPIVVLTHFSREVTLKLQNEDLSAIDYVFCWLGQADILLAIIKLIEDKMNVKHDVEVVGVQTILLVEDSIRFYSSYLPIIFKIIFKQSLEFMTEGMNEHKRMLRMRGRPKVLLATNYEEATELYEKYKKNMLGVISDIRYDREGKQDAQAGIKFCKLVQKDDPYMPFILQSSEIENEKIAKELNVGFIDKNSKTLTLELRDYLVKHLAFGDFVFKDPKTMKQIAKATDLKSLQQEIKKIPDDCLKYHINRNDFSKWLNARALFSIAEYFKNYHQTDFKSINEVRNYIYDEISKYRINKGRGVITKFDRYRYDEYTMFSRIGEGSLGGKARGLAFIDAIIKKHQLLYQYDNVIIAIPRTVVLCTDIFDEFMEDNDLYKIGLSDISDDEILKHFIEAELPARIFENLKKIISVIKNPIAIRSSSLLEDSHYQPFAGVYSTYMIPKIETNQKLMMKMLIDAIKSVYASVFYKESKAYMAITKNEMDEEKMAIIIQEVCGKRYDNKFYPTLSGVARSINFYPIEPEKSEDGVANVAFGLGKMIVDGGVTLRFSPKYPKKVLQLSDPAMALRGTQKEFIALDLIAENFKQSTDDGVNLLKLRIKSAEKDNSLKHVASSYDLQNNIIRDGTNQPGKKIITFSNILNHEVFPLADILQHLLETGQNEMNNPIEIEFAADLDTPKGSPKIFNFLQIRPIVDNTNISDLDLSDINMDDTIIFSKSALGNGIIKGVSDLVYVKPEVFNASKSEKIAFDIGKINEIFLKEDKNYILIGPGRWGSTDPWLGIPVKWSQISAAKVIIESGLENYRIDPSQGTHFFQNITSFKVGYFTINPFINDGFYDIEYLGKLKAYFEDEFIRHIRFDTEISIQIDGKNNIGVIYKANKD
ncbi:MAG: response regulator [Bacteroidales bacterium]|nr:response regulator [Bacteroidales bacterium]